MLIRQFLDARLDLLLLRGLRQRIEFAVRNDLRRDRRAKGLFRRFDLRELPVTEINTHGHPSLCMRTAAKPDEQDRTAAPARDKCPRPKSFWGRNSRLL